MSPELATDWWRRRAMSTGDWPTKPGIVSDDDFTLAPGDEVAITIDGVGTLVNHVQRGV